MKIILQNCFFFLVLFQSIGCYEPTEGCLDINASNFDVEADEPCEDCCDLPTLTIGILNRLSEADSNRSFQIDTPYPFFGDTNKIFKINRIHFYLSDIQLITDDDKIVISQDSSEISISNPPDTIERFIKNDIAYFQRGRIESKNLGSFSPSGSYKQVAFQFGIPDDLVNAVPQQISSAHPLGIQADSMNWEANDGYVFCRIDLVRDTSLNGTSGLDSVSVIKITNPKVLNIELDADFDLQSGFDTKISLRVNFMDWFKNINDLRTDPELTIKNAIIDNIPGSFSLEPVEQ